MSSPVGEVGGARSSSLPFKGKGKKNQHSIICLLLEIYLKV